MTSGSALASSGRQAAGHPSAEPGAYPGKGGEAPYCGRGAHFYEDLGHGPRRCKDCSHVLGGKR